MLVRFPHTQAARDLRGYADWSSVLGPISAQAQVNLVPALGSLRKEVLS